MSSASMTVSSVRRFQSFIPLLLLVIVYLIIAALFAALTPPWQAPDEPAHYNYVAHVARNGCCPVIEVGDWNSAYLDQLKSARFAPDLLGDLETIQYEDHQPPLYYLAQSLVYKLTNGSLIAMRFFSALFGVGTIVCAYFIVRLLVLDRPAIAFGAAALVAFLPQHLTILASVNNDSLAGFIIGLTLLGIALYLQGRDTLFRFPIIVGLGILVGLGLLTKVSTLFLAGIVPVAILVKWWTSPQTKRDLRPLLTTLITFILPALLLGGIWWLHNINVYGFPDIFGLRQHDLVVTDQARTADLIATIGFGGYLSRALETTFNSFWGQFGWMALPLPGWMYPIFLGLLVMGGSGLILAIIQSRRQTAVDAVAGCVWQRNAWIILSLTAALAVLAYIYYNTVFLQLQGRYLFSGIIPFAIGMALGVDSWRRLLLGRIAVARWLTTAVFLLLAPLDVYLILRIIQPLLKP
jgi:4-amino-4-deoxy-L-arabinose transferase-like glycosyltransferase